MARALDGYEERVTRLGGNGPTIQRAIRGVQEGIPILLKFLTAKGIAISAFGAVSIGRPKWHRAPEENFQ